MFGFRSLLSSTVSSSRRLQFVRSFNCLLSLTAAAALLQPPVLAQPITSSQCSSSSSLTSPYCTMTTPSSEPLPTLFLSHGGGPSFFIESNNPIFQFMDKNSASAKWFRNLVSQLKLQGKVKNLIVISAHWESNDAIRVTSQPNQNSLYYDYYGFPDDTYNIQWPAPGNQALASKIVELLKDNGMPAALDTKRGLDHGVFIPLKLVFPEAAIPVVQVSLHSSLSPEKHLAIGRALASLRSEGNLIIGSGFATHDLSFRLSASEGNAFANALTEALKSSPTERTNALVNWSKMPYAKKAHPREEHLIPLHVAVGANEQGKVEVIGDFRKDAFALISYMFK